MIGHILQSLSHQHRLISILILNYSAILINGFIFWSIKLIFLQYEYEYEYKYFCFFLCLISKSSVTSICLYAQCICTTILLNFGHLMRELGRFVCRQHNYDKQGCCFEWYGKVGACTGWTEAGQKLTVEGHHGSQ